MSPTPQGRRGIPTPRPHTTPPSPNARQGTPRVIAVVSDGSSLRTGKRDTAPASLGTCVDKDAAVIHELTGLPVRAVPLFACDAEDLAAQMRALTADAGAIFLTHTDPVRALTVSRALHEAGGPPVLTDADTTAISLTAALLTAVAHAGRQPAASRVVVAGAATIPELCPLLVAVGVGDISSWNASDAHAFPLHHLARHVTAVIDLLGATAQPAGSATDHRWPTVISLDPGYRLLPVPGLLRALAGHPDATLDIDVSWACAQALAAATPPGRLVPEIGGPSLTDTIVSAVARVLAQHTSSGYHGPPRTNN